MQTNPTRGQLGQLHARRLRIQDQWLRGWNGADDPYCGKGANFAAPLRSAYRDGKRKRAEIESAIAKGDGGSVTTDHGLRPSGTMAAPLTSGPRRVQSPGSQPPRCDQPPTGWTAIVRPAGGG
jgi:hypothetical protein